MFDGLHYIEVFCSCNNNPISSFGIKKDVDCCEFIDDSDKKCNICGNNLKILYQSDKCPVNFNINFQNDLT